METTPTFGVRAFAPTNYLGAATIAFAPDAEAGTGDTSPLSFADAVSAFTSVPAEEEADNGQSETEGAPEGELNADEELPEGDTEGEDVDGETTEEGQAEDVDAPEADAGKFVSPKGKVKLPDGSIVPVEELIQGNLRDRDYRQKTMELAESRKAHEVQSAAVKQKETQVAEQHDYMVQLIRSIVPKPPDVALLNTDPAAYLQQEVQYKQWSQHLNHLQQRQQQAKLASQAEATAAERETAAQEWNALQEAIPDLKDGKRLTAFAADIQKFGAEYKFTPQELQRVALDHRQAVVLRDAIAWRKLQANKGKIPAKVEGRPPVQRAGNRLAPGAQNSRQTRAAMDRLNNTGKLADGVAALLAIEKG